VRPSWSYGEVERGEERCEREEEEKDRKSGRGRGRERDEFEEKRGEKR
jgi:hypothetical protein